MLWALLTFGTMWFWLVMLCSFCAVIALLEYERIGGATLCFFGTVAMVVLFSDADVRGVLAWVRDNPFETLGFTALYFTAGTAFVFPKFFSFVKKNIEKCRDVREGLAKKWGGKATEQPLEFMATYAERLVSTGLLQQILNDHPPREIFALNILKQNFLRENDVKPPRRGRNDDERWYQDDNPEIPESLRAKWRLFLDQYLRGLNLEELLVAQPRAHKSRVVSLIAYWPWSLTWTLLNDPIRRAAKQIFLLIEGRLQALSAYASKVVTQSFAMPPPPAATPVTSAAPGSGQPPSDEDGAASKNGSGGAETLHD